MKQAYDFKEKVMRISEWLNGKNAPPFKMMLIPTNKCNLNCLFCQDAPLRRAGKFNYEKELSVREWSRVIDEAVHLGVKEFWIDGGGEPMARKEVTLMIINKIKRKLGSGSYCSITTNGTLFTSKDVENLVRIGLDAVNVSIDSCDATIHNKLRGTPGAFERSVRTLKLFKHFKLKLRKEKPALRINVVVNGKNYNRLSEMVRFFHQFGVELITLNTLRINEFNLDNVKKEKLDLNASQIKRLQESISEAMEIGKKLNVSLNINDMAKLNLEHENRKKVEEKTKGRNLPSLPFCFEPFYCMFVDPFGNVGPCSSSGKGNEENNVCEKSLKEIWYGDYFTSIRKKMIKNECLENCKHCGLLNILKPEVIDYLEVMK